MNIAKELYDIIKGNVLVTFLSGLTVKGTTNDGTTKILDLKNSDDISVASFDSSGNLSAPNLIGTNTGDETKATIEAKLTGAITSHTHSYLPLAGGTMSNTNLVTNLNADLLDGQQGSYYATASSLGSYLPLAGGTLTGDVIINKLAPYFKLTNSNGSSVSGEVIGSYDFYSNDGDRTLSGTNYAAYIKALFGSDQYGRDSELVFGTNATNATVTERMRIKSNGNVGISTSTPNYNLHVNGTLGVTDAATFSNRLNVTTSIDGNNLGLFNNSHATGYGLAINGGSTTRYILSLRDYAGTEKFIFRADGTSSFAGAITAPSFLGVATSANRVNLTSTNEVVLGGDLTGGGTLYVNYNDSGSFTNYGFYGGGTSYATLTATNFILGSDLRLKENITPISISNIDSVEIKQFNLISDTEKRTRYGVIAQELELVAPEMVYTDKDGMKSVGYTDFLIAKVASQDNRIKELESTLALVLDRLNNLEGK